MKVGTFFSGVGSPEQALNNLGIEHEIEFACDIDKYAKQTYLKNFNTKQFYTDITTLDMKNLSYVDLLVFGFPCQAFSLAGKRGGFEDTRGTLFYDALRYLKEHRPRYFIAENVKGLVSHDKGKTFQTIIDCLASTVNTQMSILPFDNLGYHIHYKVLNTKNFGIPQNRERIFIIGIRDDADNDFTFPKEFPLELKLKDILQDNPNSKYFNLSNSQQQMINDENDIKRYINSDIIDKFNKGDCADISFPNGYNKANRVFKELTPAITNTTVSSLVVKVDDKYYLSDKMIKYISKSGTKNFYYKPEFMDLNGVSKPLTTVHDKSAGTTNYLKVKEGLYDIVTHSLYPRSGNPKQGGTGHLSKSDGTSYCLDTGNAQAIQIKENRIRRLTPIECERLQGFPDNHTEGVSDTQRYKQMGNSITVNVMMELFKKLLK